METNLNEKQIKGLDMVIRAISKKYKFIKGWELSPEHNNYEAILTIQVIMDYQEFADTYNYYTKPNRYTKRTAYSPSIFLGRDEEDYNKSYNEKDKTVYQEVRQIKSDIENNIKEIYERIPDEFISFFSTIEYPDKLHPRGISITDWIDTYEPPSLTI